MALLEALSYAAIVEANHGAVLYDSRLWDLRPSHPQPGLLILGDARYWQYWAHTPAAKGWRAAFTEFIADLERSIGLNTWLPCPVIGSRPPWPGEADRLTYRSDQRVALSKPDPSDRIRVACWPPQTRCTDRIKRSVSVNAGPTLSLPLGPRLGAVENRCHPILRHHPWATSGPSSVGRLHRPGLPPAGDLKDDSVTGDVVL